MTLRFHHLHYRAADPLTAMRRIAGPGAQPTILQGLGAGVRVGGSSGQPEYVLFDRLAAAPVPAPTPPGTALPRIVEWLSSQGFAVSAEVANVRALSDRLATDTFDHMGLAASNFPEALDRLRRSGARLSNSTDESVFVEPARSGLRFEIVRDPDLPDAFWCPMHPDVRSASAGSCPICRMTLVPIPAPRIGEYRMDVTVMPNRRGGGASGLRLTLRDPDSTAERAPALLVVHDKRLHLFVIGHDLQYFAHVHPEARADGSFEIRQELPAGEYMVSADFLPAGGTPQMVQRAIATPGEATRGAAMPAVALRPSSTALLEGVRATIDAPTLVTGQTSRVRVTLTDDKTRDPITDLEPYLSAPAHAVLASADLTHVVHVHPQEQEAFGPSMSFDVLPAVTGPYKIWVQVQRHGRVLTFPFVLGGGK
jgi:hypothetical protein